jgi:hypothetical protein
MGGFLELLVKLTSFRRSAKCVFCGKHGLKSEMVFYGHYGWFCNMEELRKFWMESQW